ncbi:hypothetical protein XENORESO_014711 [Xenotaenia resolanae]|uniref:Uncharacterized protein n=1 Tax=Xenotaenia resolanae TaxID=208358 RepID=A0ABV0VM21_9TELE
MKCNLFNRSPRFYYLQIINHARRLNKGQHVSFLNNMQAGHVVFHNILNQLITHKISCADAQTFTQNIQNNTTMKQCDWYGNLLMVHKTSVCRRREQTESGSPN